MLWYQESFDKVLEAAREEIMTQEHQAEWHVF